MKAASERARQPLLLLGLGMGLDQAAVELPLSLQRLVQPAPVIHQSF